MKKYLLGSFAIVIAIASVAFTKPRASIFFKFTPTTYSSTLVDNEANYVEDINQGCSQSAKACMVEVDASLVSNPGGTRTLQNSTSVLVQPISTGSGNHAVAIDPSSPDPAIPFNKN